MVNMSIQLYSFGLLNDGYGLRKMICTPGRCLVAPLAMPDTNGDPLGGVLAAKNTGSTDESEITALQDRWKVRQEVIPDIFGMLRSLKASELLAE